MTVYRFDWIMSTGIAEQFRTAFFDKFGVRVERIVSGLGVLAIHVIYFTRSGKLYKPLMYVVK